MSAPSTLNATVSTSEAPTSADISYHQHSTNTVQQKTTRINLKLKISSICSKLRYLVYRIGRFQVATPSFTVICLVIALSVKLGEAT